VSVREEKPTEEEQQRGGQGSGRDRGQDAVQVRLRRRGQGERAGDEPEHGGQHEHGEAQLTFLCRERGDRGDAAGAAEQRAERPNSSGFLGIGFTFGPDANKLDLKHKRRRHSVIEGGGGNKI